MGFLNVAHLFLNFKLQSSLFSTKIGWIPVGDNPRSQDTLVSFNGKAVSHTKQMMSSASGHKKLGSGTTQDILQCWNWNVFSKSALAAQLAFLLGKETSAVDPSWAQIQEVVSIERFLLGK